MKKVLTVLVCLLLAAVLTVPAFAAIQDGEVELKASAAELHRGDTFTVEAYLTNKEALTLCTVVLDYDTSVFELTGGTSHVPGAMLGMVQVANKVGTAVLQTPAAFEGKVFTFNFTVKADAKFGDCKINAAASIGNGTGNDITAEGTSVEIVCAHEWSDWSKVDDTIQKRTCSICEKEEQEYIDYTVTFVDENGAELSKNTYHWGDEVAAPADPVKAADNTYAYAFSGWDKEVVACAGDATYTATYKATYIDYTVIFADENGTELSKNTYHWGDEVVAPADPVKAADNTYTYAFNGWDKEVAACAGDATYTATYKATYIDYTVIFADENGAELSKNTYHWGDEVAAPADPVKAADNTYAYAFSGWDKEVVACAGDATYTATYKATYIDYTVIFADENGAELSKNTYHWGDEVAAPADPAKAADNTYTYAFDGWDKEVAACAGDATYTATYKATYIEYTVTFQYDDGTVIKVYTLHYGDEVTAPDAPAVPEALGEKYVFDGWGKEVVACAGNATYVAQFKLANPGDIDENEEVNTDDVIQLLLHVSMPDMFAINVDADFTGDGQVTTDDVIQLLLHVSMPDVFPLNTGKKED